MIFNYKIIEMCKSYIYELGLNEKIYEKPYIEKIQLKL
jgi:hypothetical protein